MFNIGVYGQGTGVAGMANVLNVLNPETNLLPLP